MKMKAKRWPKNTSSSSAIGLLLVCISLFVWLLIDTLVALIPPSKITIGKFDSSPALANAYPGADNVHLWWIIQISDLHISSYRNFHVPDDLELFLKEVIPAVKPLAVLATGDITDGRKVNSLHTAQELTEWQRYRSVLEQQLLYRKKADRQSITWIDMRGNHDNFNVPSHTDDFYMEFSPFAHRWKKNGRHTIHRFSVNDTSYALVAIDATPNPGFRRPYNFFGVLPDETLDELRRTDNELAMEGVQLALWSGHYTTSTIFMGAEFSSERKLIGDVIRHGAIYLCGHLHTLFDVERTLYARHVPLGQLELELADFQKTQRFRLVAVDHGLLSFTDATLRQWPVVLVVNPKEALYAMPNHEPLDKIAKSTHVRILAFSTSPIASMQVMLDGKFIGNASRHPVAANLFTLPWSPQTLARSLFHQLDVTVIDAKERSTSKRVTFFVDLKAVHHLQANIGGPVASFIMLWNLPKIFRNAFVASSLFCIILLMAGRLHPKVFLKVLPIKVFANGFVAFCKLPGFLFMTMLFAIAYPLFGPWFIGEMLTGRYAFVFAHGIILLDDGTFIPCAVVTFHGFLNVVTFYFPLLAYFSWIFSSSLSKRPILRRLSQFVLVFLIALQLWAAYCDAQAYGWLAFVFSPLRTWSSIVVVYVDIKTRENLRHR